MAKIAAAMLMSSALYAQFCQAFDQAKSTKRLEAALSIAVGELLRRGTDITYRAEILAEIEMAFSTGGELFDLIPYAKAMLRRVLEERQGLNRTADAEADRTHADFPALFRAALRRRIDRNLAFFQRRDALFARDVTPPFLLSSDFSRRLFKLIDRDIVPTMMTSRQMRMLESQHAWAQVTEGGFWDKLGDSYSIVGTLWEHAWNGLRPTRRQTEAGVKYIVGPALKRLREDLASDDYALLRVDDKVLSLFVTLIDEDLFATPALQQTWTSLRQIYEQEMDPRSGQEPARQGALRDALLACFDTLDDSVAQFLVLLCYWNFPRLRLSYLTAFSANMGVTREARLQRVPYLMWFLELPETETARMAEDRGGLGIGLG